MHKFHLWGQSFWFSALFTQIIYFPSLKLANLLVSHSLTSWYIISRWVPFNIASPLLDRKPYVVLSDHALLQDGESSTPPASEIAIEVQHDDNCDEDTNDVLIDDTEMIEPESESSDDGSGPETSVETLENFDVGDILIGLKGSRVRYKVCKLFLFLSYILSISLICDLLSV